MTSFMSKGKGKNRTVFPIKNRKGSSKNSFNKKSSMTKSRFKVPTLPNDPPRNPTVDELTPSEQKKTLEILNMLDSSGSGLDKQGKELKKQLERKRKISTMPNDPPKSKTVSLSNKLEEIGDSSADERIFEVKGVEANPELDDVDPPKRVSSDIIIRVTNFLEATGDSQFEDEPYVGEVLLVPKNKSLSEDVLERIADSAGIDEDKVDHFDKIGYGASIRLGDELTGDDPIEVANELAKEAPAQAGLIGFALDQPVNRMGETGWDQLRKFAL